VSKLASLSAFHGIAAPGRYGKADGDAGVTIAERANLGLATVEVRKGQDDSLKVAVREDYGLDLPEGSTVSAGNDLSFIGTGPGQWIVVSGVLGNETLAHELAVTLRGLASVSDQSSGRAVVHLSGPRARDVILKGLAIDLDPRVFGPGQAVTSTISHMGVLVWREGESEEYDVALFRSVAESFWRWLSASAAEYGYAVVTTS
jgi:methylglutamate dehydrogenase subunit D